MSANDSAKQFKLPLVPGMSCGEELLRTNYRKTQIFGGNPNRATKSLPVPVDYAQVNLALTKADGNNEEGSPSKVDLSNRVLRFYGFTREAVQESAIEKERIRKITLNYYLEDGTLSVSEPKEDNSGFAFAGTLVKRHIVSNKDGSPLTFLQLAIGQPVTFYGRTYVLTDCDAFTRSFLASAGFEVPEGTVIPTDAHSEMRSRPAKAHDVPSIAATSTLNITLSAAQIRATKQFLANDRCVLRCDCTWDDNKNLYGETHYLTMYYFLSDDSIAVVEKDSVNSGRDPFPNFIRRQRIPRPRDSSGRFENMNSSLTFAGKDVQQSSFYSDRDIVIGNVLNLFGRLVRICDYDTFTQDYLREKYGVTEYHPIDISIPAKPKVVREPPPYNGFGDEQDSLGNCQRLDIKPPRKDGSRFAKYGNSVVKYALKLDNGVATDEIRRFVLTCFLADDTISIFEPVQRNSGIVGGKFLQRQKVKNADGKVFVASDFFVGCHVTINGFPFIVTATDERSLSFMESNPGTFSHSDVNNVVHKVQAMLLSNGTGLARALRDLDEANPSGTLDFAAFATGIRKAGIELSDQELITILRHFDHKGDSLTSYEELVSRILPEGSAVGQDARSWQAILQDMSNSDASNVAQAAQSTQEREKKVAAAAAQGARIFLDLYNQRRALFHQEFKFVLDYARDTKVGEREFKICVRDRLRLSAIGDEQLAALCQKLFPEGSRRITYEELLRLFNGTSNLSHNLPQIRDRN